MQDEPKARTDQQRGVSDQNRAGFGRFVDGWTTLRAWERDGAFYERMGLRPLFALVAALFGERLPLRIGDAGAEAADAIGIAQPTGSAQNQRPTHAPDHAAEDLLRIYARSRYHEIVNLIALAVYAPLPVWLIALGLHIPALYVAVLLTPHALCIPLERYKRARADALLSARGITSRSLSLTDTWRPQLISLPPILRTRGAGRWFGPWPLESDRLYRRLGVRPFRAFVRALFGASATGGASETGRGFVRGRGDLAAFEAQTRVSEVTHVVGLLLHLPLLAVFVRIRSIPGILYVLFMLWVNLQCVLLQRWHRARIEARR